MLSDTWFWNVICKSWIYCKHQRNYQPELIKTKIITIQSIVEGVRFGLEAQYQESVACCSPIYQFRLTLCIAADWHRGVHGLCDYKKHVWFE